MRIGARWASGGGRKLTEAEKAELARRQEEARRIDALSQKMREEAPQEIVEHHMLQPVESDVILGSTRITEWQKACFDPELVLQDDPPEVVKARGYASTPQNRELDNRVDLACGLSIHSDPNRQILIKKSGSTLLDLGEGYLCAPGLNYAGREQNLAFGQFQGLGQEIDPRDGTIFLSVHRQVRESAKNRLDQPMPEDLKRLTFHDGSEFEERRWQRDPTRALYDTYLVRPDGSVQGYEFRQIGSTWEGGHVELTLVKAQLEPDGTVVTESGHSITPWISHQQLFGPRPVQPELEAYYAREAGTHKVTVQEGPRFEIQQPTTGVDDTGDYLQLPGVRLRKRQ